MPSRNRVEEERIRRFLMARGREVKEPVGIPCPYLGDTGCTIHPVRPLICRLYGTSPSYLCKMGVRPVQLLHEDEEADIFRRYLALSSSSLT
jgi:Fe-S-cluster containining protein